MAKKPSSDLLNLLFGLQHSREAQQQAVPDTTLDARLALLRGWQSRRLASTYADLLQNDQYRSACQFFLENIYAPRDFSQRDHDAEHLHALLARHLPESMLRLLAGTIRMNQLTNHLDQKLIHALFEDLGVTDRITSQAYAAAYRICDNYAERKAQIELLVDILGEAAHGARRPIFAISLHLARIPAYHAGWFELYDFLEKGYAACKPMQNVNFFVSTIHQREMNLLDNIFAGDPEPFREFTIDD